jgi:hypothetical protein
MACSCSATLTRGTFSKPCSNSILSRSFFMFLVQRSQRCCLRKENQSSSSVRFQVLTAANMKLRIFWDVAYCRVLNWMSTPVSIIRAMMDAAPIYETSVDNKLRTRQYIPEDYELQNSPNHVCGLGCSSTNFQNVVPLN